MIVGLGGIGGYVLEELCRAGVGKIIVVDYDIFEETNLNRQLLATEKNLGCKKVDIAKKRATEINSTVEVNGFEGKVENLPEIYWKGIELVFDCLDNIESRLYLEEKTERQKIPLVHGAVAGWYGQIAMIFPGSNLLTKIYQKHKKGIEEVLGAPSFIPALVASLMVALGIKYLLGNLKEGNIFYFVDLKNLEFEKIEF